MHERKEGARLPPSCLSASLTWGFENGCWLFFCPSRHLLNLRDNNPTCHSAGDCWVEISLTLSRHGPRHETSHLGFAAVRPRHVQQKFLLHPSALFRLGPAGLWPVTGHPRGKSSVSFLLRLPARMHRQYKAPAVSFASRAEFAGWQASSPGSVPCQSGQLQKDRGEPALQHADVAANISRDGFPEIFLCVPQYVTAPAGAAVLRSSWPWMDNPFERWPQQPREQIVIAVSTYLDMQPLRGPSDPGCWVGEEALCRSAMYSS